MNKYETMIIIKASLEDKEREDLLLKINDFFTKNSIEFLANHKIGVQNLAYPIKKNNRGFYSALYYKAEGDVILAFEKFLRHNEDILKFLTIKFTNLNEIALFNRFVEAHKSA